jgi:WD40 repeat protein
MRSGVFGLLGLAILQPPAAVQAMTSETAATCPPPGLQFETKVSSLGIVKGMKTSIWSGAPDHRWTLTTSPDGKRVAYSVHKGASKGWLALAPLMVGRNDQAKAVVDGVEGPPYEGVDTAVFSPDSRRVAYRAVQGGKMSVGMSTVGRIHALVVVDGVEGPGYDLVSRPVFSPDSAHIAYSAVTGKRGRVVLDGVAGEEYDAVSSPVFSPDSQRVAYAASRGKEVLVVNGTQVTPVSADNAVDLAFSPDGRRLAYKANRGKQFFVVVDGSEGPSADSIGTVVFSPDGRLSYLGRQDKAAFVVIEGAAPRRHAANTKVGDPVFSSDGRRLAYAIDEGKKERVIVDGRADKDYDEIGRVVFSPDGRHVAYDARQGQKWHLVVDEADGPEYPEVVRGHFVFERPDLIRYFGFRKDEIVRSEVQITCERAGR